MKIVTISKSIFSLEIRIILKELDFMLTLNDKHKMVFSEIPNVGFKNNISLLENLTRSV